MEKKKYELEYTLNTSPKVLFERLSTPGGLAEWFADDVNVAAEVFTFLWEGSMQEADLMNIRDQKYIRFRWKGEENENTFFEFRIRQDELTGDVALLITDFAGDEDKADAISLWDSQISDLKRALGL
jgi:uncharacterized protein YndB with AHSA1/START domain